MEWGELLGPNSICPFRRQIVLPRFLRSLCSVPLFRISSLAVWDLSVMRFALAIHHSRELRYSRSAVTELFGRHTAPAPAIYAAL